MNDQDLMDLESVTRERKIERAIAAESMISNIVDAEIIEDEKPQPIEGELLQKVFVYGTLKSGFSRNNILAQRGSKFVKLGHIEGWMMRHLGEFPSIYPSPNGYERVYGEVWECPEKCIELLDRIEGVSNGFYKRIKVLTYGMGPCWVYVQEKPVISSWNCVIGGTWTGPLSPTHVVYQTGLFPITRHAESYSQFPIRVEGVNIALKVLKGTRPAELHLEDTK